MIPALRTWKQNGQEFKANLSYLRGCRKNKKKKTGTIYDMKNLKYIFIKLLNILKTNLLDINIKQLLFKIVILGSSTNLRQ